MSTLSTPPKDPTFLHCRCPDCKRPFDYVPVDSDNCPFCRSEIDSAMVWQTRRYPGILILPGWVRAFGWPFLLILAGVGAFAYPYFAYHMFEAKLPALLISIGMIFFFVKLNTNGEY